MPDTWYVIAIWRFLKPWEQSLRQFIVPDRKIVWLSFTTAVSGFVVTNFMGIEEINQPYKYVVELEHEHAVPVADLVGMSGFLSVRYKDGFIRKVHGVIAQAEVLMACPNRYHVLLVPRLGYLDTARGKREYANTNARAIISEVLEANGLGKKDFSFSRSAGKEMARVIRRKNESDLHFVQRICKLSGWHFSFFHSPRNHHLRFASIDERLEDGGEGHISTLPLALDLSRAVK